MPYYLVIKSNNANVTDPAQPIIEEPDPSQPIVDLFEDSLIIMDPTIPCAQTCSAEPDPSQPLDVDDSLVVDLTLDPTPPLTPTEIDALSRSSRSRSLSRGSHSRSPRLQRR